MKICLFGDAHSVHIHQLAPRLAARGHVVHVVSHKQALIPGVTVEQFRVPRASVINPKRWEARRKRYLDGFLRRFDVVNIQFLHDWGFTPEMVDDGAFMASPWGSDIVPPPGETVSDVLMQQRAVWLRRATTVTACGPGFAKAIARFADIDTEAVAIAPLGVDTNLFRPARATDSSSAVVGFFKGFRAVYGPTYLIRAIPRVLDQCAHARFELIGDGPQLDECKALAKHLGVADNITWLPRQPHDTLPRHMAGWDVSVVSSECESFCVAALESSAMRVPVVATNVGGLPDTVHDGTTGLLVEPRNPDALADGIATLLSDAATRERFGRAGREMVKRRYEWDTKAIAAWERAFEMTLDRVSVMV